MFIKYALLILFFLTMIGVGIYCRKHTKSVDGFVLGGRNAGPWLTAFAYGTSYFSSVVFVGYAGQFGWRFGLASTWIGLGNAFLGSLLAWLVLAKRTRTMTTHLSSATMPDFFGKRFNSKSIKIAASMIAFVFLVPYTASIYNGLSRLFGVAFNIDYKICVIAMALLTAVYVVLGGYMATAINDLIQGAIMLVGIVAVISSVLNGQGGFTSAVNKLSLLASDQAATQGQVGAFTSIFGADPISLFSVIILTSLGTWGLPQMVHKFYTIKDERSIKAGTVISTVFALVIAGGCYFLGGFSRLFPEAMADGLAYDKIIPFMVGQLSDLLIGVVIVLVLSASMSTLSSLVLTSSSTLVLDFLKGNIVKKMTEKSQIKWMRIFIVAFIALSVVLALNPPTFIAQLMGISWGALAGAFLAPFMYSLYSKNITRASIWCCFASGIGITVVNMFFPFTKSPIEAGALAMVAGLVVVPLVSLFTPKLDKKTLEAYFSCFEQK